MIVDERMVTYINSLDTGSGQFLDQLELQAKKDRVPIIRRRCKKFPESASADQKTDKDSGSRDGSRFFCTSDGPTYARRYQNRYH